MRKHFNLRSMRDARMCCVEINLPCNSTALTLHRAYHEVAIATRACEAGGLEAKPLLRRHNKDKVSNVWVRKSAVPLLLKIVDDVFGEGEALPVYGKRYVVS